MKKRFRSHKKIVRLKFLKIVFIILLCVIIYTMFKKIDLNINIINDDKNFVKLLLMDSNHHMFKDKNNVIIDLSKTLTKKDNIKPISLLENTYYYPQNNASDMELLGEKAEYVYDPNPTIYDEPKVYLYNTHQLEGYDKKISEEHSIKPSIMMASYILKEKLSALNIPTIVEMGDIALLVNSNGWAYNKSYKASRYFIEDTLKKYDSLDLIIDIHRDAISKKDSTVTINSKNYAKVLFVIGMEHKNYDANLKVATKINDLILKKYPTLTRGILKKEGKNVDGIYNQDLNSNIILLECGGYKNTIDEVNNTMELLSEIIKEYLEEL